MTGPQLKAEREKKGWTQERVAALLGVSQSYLAQLEKGNRRMTDRLVRAAAELYETSPVLLPLRSSPDTFGCSSSDRLAGELAALGYPGFSYLRESLPPRNPAEVLVSALQANDLDSRLTEALPWVVLTFPGLDWQWLVSAAKLRDLQNRLGFVTNVARRLAETEGDHSKAALLREKEELLERSRLARQDTLCHDSLTPAERRWLLENRPDEARHWELLTDLSPEHLSYAA
jgi:transcriptional regulator with XRE-family HTH domain